MTVIAMLSVAPIVKESMPGEVAKTVTALDDFKTSYETNPMGMVVEIGDIDELLAAVGAAHEAVDGGRVGTSLRIGGKRTRKQIATDKVDVVEAHLGQETRSNRE